jgi:molecular chaperone DnaK (HSP70)
MAIQACMKLRIDSKGVRDITNHSLGTEFVGGNFDIIIPKCSNIPI